MLHYHPDFSFLIFYVAFLFSFFLFLLFFVLFCFVFVLLRTKAQVNLRLSSSFELFGAFHLGLPSAGINRQEPPHPSSLWL